MDAIETVTAFDRFHDTLHRALDTDESTLRAEAVAAALRSLWPSAKLTACLLWNARPDLAALDTRGRPDGRVAESLGTGPAAGEAEGHLTAWKRALDRPGQLSAVHSVRWDDHWFGTVAVVLDETNNEALALAGPLLASCSHTLAGALERQRWRRKCAQLRDESAGQAWLANVGELAGPVAHEFLNFLNALLLHVAVLEQELPEKYRADLDEVRRQGDNATEVVRQFQEYRRGRPPACRPVDLAALVREAAEELAREPPAFGTLPIDVWTGPRLGPTDDGSVSVLLQPADDLPGVSGSAGDLRRLARFLIANAARAASQNNGQVVVRLERTPDGAALAVEDTGPTPDAEALEWLFETAGAGRPGAHPLELAACQSLVRRLGGSLRAEARPGGGLVVVADLPTNGGEGVF